MSVPRDPLNPEFDVLMGKIGTRTHFIHLAMAAHGQPMSPDEIGTLAETYAIQAGYPVKANTFTGQTTRNHLISMRDKKGRQYAEQTEDRRWQLTTKAWMRINSAS